MTGGSSGKAPAVRRGPALVLCGALAAFGAAAFGGAGASAAGGAGTDDGTGAHLYRRDCAWCHGVDGEGTSRGVTLVGVGAASADFYLSTGRMPIAAPDDTIERSRPAYADEDIARIVEHVASFGDGPDIPDVGDRGDVAEGGALYRLHCSQCHGGTGVGVALAAGVMAPEIVRSTPTQVAESLIVGPGAMPAFVPSVLTEEEMASVSRYVEELATGEDHGGHPLARAGRLDELLVAWFVAGVAFVAAARAVAGPARR